MNPETKTPERKFEGTSRQSQRRRLFIANFAAYPGFVQGNRVGNVSAHSKYGRFLPRAERRRLARAFAAGEWRKRHDVVEVGK